MEKQRTIHRATLCLVASVATLLASSASNLRLWQPQLVAQAQQQVASRIFPETGKTVRGRFLHYWLTNGGLIQQGFPITEELDEISDLDGKVYTVQYFERALFEYHPEHEPPNDVLLALLGTFLYAQKYPNGAQGQFPNMTGGSVLFPESGKRLGGTFLQYWKSNGGLRQQGLPISDEFQERSELDGRTYLVQYFERAVLELHAEVPPPDNVLLSQLGTFRYRARYAGENAQPIKFTGRPVPSGPWEEVQVVRVVDGDTIEVSLGGQRKTVRYIGVNTPETVDPNSPVECYGPEASTANKAMVEGKFVYLEKDVSETDRYGRLLRYVFVPSAFVNAELVKQGYAQVGTYPPDVKFTDLFLQLQEQARGAARGLWGDACKASPTVAATPTRRPTTPPTRVPPMPPRPGGGVCGTSYSPSGPDRDCDDFSTQSQAQCFFRAAGGPGRDPHRLDADNDGVACEALR